MNSETVDWLNQLSSELLAEEFRNCCGADWWCRRMASSGPFASAEEVHLLADINFDRLAEVDWLEAFAAHPRIGDLNSLRMKFAGNRIWSHGEQAGVDPNDEAVLQRLSAKNDSYFQRFGFIFIICAAGKRAVEMLAALEDRLPNDPATELRIAAAEQRKITHLRLDKLEKPAL